MPNAPCMKNGQSSKGYPKHFQERTAVNNDNYPIYMRKDNGRTVEVRRMYFVHSTAGEHYYLRLLLNVVSGATSFPNLRTVNSILYNTFKEACDALGLLQNDKEWDRCLAEAALIQSGSQLRHLFATFLLFCNPIHPETLWEKYFTSFSDDIRLQLPDIVNSNTNLHNQALLYLQSILNNHERSLHDFPNMPIPIRSQGHIALAIASSEIASLLLPGGRTAHSRFKLPFTLHKSSTCSIPHRSALTELLQKASLIIWNEAPMAHRNAPEALNRTLQDLMKAIDPAFENLPFGGKIFIFGGDFQQILPVVVKGGREDIVSSSLKRSPL
ncbi:10250_t:CDS:2 [Cetraspora pellucida]|uniref:ATP-dependent DNA helicase n=1 Tax=Cetraspora pellucida TaxID=1433469 RepID=A0A9N9NS42_9GLOM|nr:10250_t:CDS:2 [Cetraspora pellucida]